MQRWPMARRARDIAGAVMEEVRATVGFLQKQRLNRACLRGLKHATIASDISQHLRKFLVVVDGTPEAMLLCVSPRDARMARRQSGAAG